MLAVRRARGIEERWLRNENKGPFGMPAVSNRVFRRGDLFERAAEVHGDGAPALARAPWNRLGESVVDLERARVRAEIAPCAPVTWRESVAGDDSSWRGEVSQSVSVLSPSNSRKRTASMRRDV